MHFFAPARLCSEMCWPTNVFNVHKRQTNKNVMAKKCRQKSSVFFSQLFVSASQRMHVTHRNLRTRPSMLGLAQQIFLGKEDLVKNRLISTADKVIYLKRNNFSGVYKNLSSLHEIGWRSAENILPFFKHASSSVPSS
jgi:hypothetical protein